MEYFEEVETTKEYDGYYYEVAEVISIVVLGSPCGLKNMKQVHQWASNERTREFLRKELGIERIPCYYWFLCLLKLVKPESLNRCLKKWAERLLLADRKAVSVALDGKTIRSTGKVNRYESPLHIISAQLCEMGITLDSRSTEGKGNEIPAVQELLEELDLGVDVSGLSHTLMVTTANMCCAPAFQASVPRTGAAGQILCRLRTAERIIPHRPVLYPV